MKDTPLKAVIHVAGSELLLAVGKAFSIINPNPVAPITSNVLVAVSNNALTISSTDLRKTYVSGAIILGDTSGATTWRVCLPGKLLRDTLTALPNQPLRLDLDTDGRTVTIWAGRNKYVVKGEDAANFPALPAFADWARRPSPPFQGTAAQWRDALSKTLPFTADEILQPALSAVFTSVDDKGMRLAAFYSAALCVWDNKGLDEEESLSKRDPRAVLIPNDSGRVLLSMLPSAAKGARSGIEYATDGTMARWIGEFGTLWSQTVEGVFPEYERLLPKAFSHLLLVDNATFKGIANRLNLFVTVVRPQMILDLHESPECRALAHDADTARSGEELIPCEYTGDPLKCAYSAKLVVKALGALPEGNVAIEFTGANKPAVFRGIEEDAEAQVYVLLAAMQYEE